MHTGRAGSSVIPGFESLDPRTADNTVSLRSAGSISMVRTRPPAGSARAIAIAE